MLRAAWILMPMMMLAPVLVPAGSVPSELVPSEPVTHASQYQEISPKASFPRCSQQQLHDVGFPDHMHAYWWPSWEVMTDENGETYGPRAFCLKKKVLPRENLLIEDGHLAWRYFETRQNTRYKPCDFLLLLETLDWAQRSVSSALGLTPTDTLRVVSPDDLNSYREATEQDIWRLYKLEGNTVIIEPFGTLQARTLDGHAVFAVVTDWLLREQLPTELPPWLHHGLAEYFSENGAHLLNYMVQFRGQGSPVLSVPTIDFILSRGVDPDPGKDREMYRRASYSAFLMAWELVENRGGVKKLRKYLDKVREGSDLDKAARKVYGLSMEELAKSLDPVELGEPVGDAVQARRPAQRPAQRPARKTAN